MFLTSPLVLFCLHVRFENEANLLPHDACFAEVLDYVFYNDTITFDGRYSVGESECTTVRVFAPDDNLVESTEVFNATVFPRASSLTSVSIFIIDNDCKWVFVL